MKDVRKSPLTEADLEPYICPGAVVRFQTSSFFAGRIETEDKPTFKEGMLVLRFRRYIRFHNGHVPTEQEGIDPGQCLLNFTSKEDAGKLEIKETVDQGQPFRIPLASMQKVTWSNMPENILVISFKSLGSKNSGIIIFSKRDEDARIIQEFVGNGN